LTKLKIPFTISVIATILIIGGLIASPDAYSDKKHDNVPDECQCEKPHTLKVLFTAPEHPIDVTFKAEIFKNLNDKNNEEKLLDSISLTPNDPSSPSMVEASAWGKDKLESNTAFVIYKIGVDENNEATKVLVSEMEIHTSCSKPLYIDMVVFDVNDPGNGYSLKVDDGLRGEIPDIYTSIPIANPNSCEDEKKKSTGSITIKKALTNDNGGEAEFGDFEITVTNVETTEKFPVITLDDLGMGVMDVPAGTYTLNEKELVGYTTVMIAGDTGCPSMLEEVFTIKKNKNLSCTIYNDDDGSSGGPGGIVFENNSLQILIDALPNSDPDGDDIPNHLDDDWDNDGTPNNSDPDFIGSDTLDSCIADIVFDENQNEVIVRNSTPCIMLVDDNEIAILDDALKDNTRTIILFSAVENSFDDGAAKNLSCFLDRLVPYSEYDEPDVSPDITNLAAVFSCDGLTSNEVVNINYAMIDPLF